MTKKHKTLDAIIKNNANIKEAIDKDPSLYHSLVGVHDEEFQKYRLAIGAYDLVDKYDKYFAIAETVLRVPGPGLNMIGYAALRIPELFAKGLAGLYYGVKTNDWKGVSKLMAMELAETVVPFGEMGNLAPAYKMTAEKMLEYKVQKKFEELYLKENISEYDEIRKAA